MRLNNLNVYVEHHSLILARQHHVLKHLLHLFSQSNQVLRSQFALNSTTTARNTNMKKRRQL